MSIEPGPKCLGAEGGCVGAGGDSPKPGIVRVGSALKVVQRRCVS